MHLDRRQFAMVGGAAVACGAMLVGAARPLAAESTDPTAVVDRWLNEIVRLGVADRIEEFVRPDIVVVLHGVGASQDGTPRQIEGLAALRDWLGRSRSRLLSPPEIRLDDRLVDGGKVAVRGRNVWHVRTDTGRIKTTQSLAAFYYVEAGRLYRAERYAAQIRTEAG